MVAGVGDHGKLHRVAVAVTESSVVHAKTFLLQAAQSVAGIVGMRLKLGVEPEQIARRQHADGSASMSAIDDSRQVIAIDGFGNSAAKRRGGKPFQLVSGNGSRGNLIEPELFG